MRKKLLWLSIFLIIGTQTSYAIRVDCPPLPTPTQLPNGEWQYTGTAIGRGFIFKGVSPHQYQPTDFHSIYTHGGGGHPQAQCVYTSDREALFLYSNDAGLKHCQNMGNHFDCP